MSIIDSIWSNRSKNWRNYWLGMALYGATIYPGLYLAQTYFAESPVRYFLVMLPIIPVLWASWALIQYILEQDELVQKIHLEATLLAAVFICVFTFVYGFLEAVGLPHLRAPFIFPIFMLVWSIAYFFTKNKYGLPMINTDSEIHIVSE